MSGVMFWNFDSPFPDKTQKVIRILPGSVALLLVVRFLPLVVSATERQSQAQDFVITLNDTPNGLIIDVDERDSGERLTCTLHFDEETADMDALGTQGATDRIDGGSRVFTASALML
jgi:hypothetical protein